MRKVILVWSIAQHGSVTDGERRKMTFMTRRAIWYGPIFILNYSVFTIMEVIKVIKVMGM